VFHVALPVYIWNEIASADASNAFDSGLVIFCVTGIIASFAILVITTPLFVKSRPSRGAFIQGVYRANFAILGVPLAKNLFGDEGGAAAALILPFAITLFNVLAVTVLTINSEGTDGKARPDFKKILIDIAKNPLIITIFIALPFTVFKWKLIAPLQQSVNFFANTSTPLALISLGAGIDIATLKGKIGLSLTAALTRTAVLPVIACVPAILLGFRGAQLVVIFVLFAAPTAVSSYIMAKNMRSDYELAGQIVALTTAICPVTVFAGSFALRWLGFI
jgi:predicted permease